MKIKLFGVLLLVVAVGTGSYYATTVQKEEMTPAALVESTTETQSSSSTSAITETATGTDGVITATGTLPELLSKSGNLHCTFSHSEKDLQFLGDVYVSNGKLRADVNAKVAVLGDKTIETHTVSFDGFAYAWTNLAAQGTKMQIPEGKTLGDISPTSGVNSTRFTYTCKPETIDQSLFSLPPGIEFQVAFPQS